jgi:hypothetical protein
MRPRLLVLVTPVLALAAAAVAAPAPPTLVSLRPSAAAGSDLTVAIGGTGLAAPAAVPQVRGTDGQVVAVGWVATRSATGMTAVFRLAGARPGRYRVIVTEAGGAPSNAVELTLSPEVGISPASGPPGTPFTYSGRGFTGRGGLTSHLEGRDGRIWQDKRIGASPEGTFEQTIQSDEFRPGLYTVWASDDVTQVRTAAFTFEVTGPTRAPSPRP